MPRPIDPFPEQLSLIDLAPAPAVQPVASFPLCREAGFDVAFSYHADAILSVDFPGPVAEVDQVLAEIAIPLGELIGGGGGEAKVTQRLRTSLAALGWAKQTFITEKRTNNRLSHAQSHEVDHVKETRAGTLALEIEWNNKDPFFDRDLENFNRLHADGAISIGLIVTRGASLQIGIEGRLAAWAEGRGIASLGDLRAAGLTPTERQRLDIEGWIEGGASFAEAWARKFVADKYSPSTTHWAKLKARLDRGVGSPCPIVALGIPIGVVTG